MAVEVHLLAVEGALLLQAAQGVAQPLKLRPPALATQTLLPDVLEGSTERTCDWTAGSHDGTWWC